MSVYENAKNVIKRVKALNPDVEIVAATKMQSVEAILEAKSAGIEVFAENKAQDFRDKYPILSDLCWHFIGSLQPNKVKYLVGKVDVIESVGDKKTLDEISRLAKIQGVVQKVFLQVNVGKEESKSGVFIEDFDSIYEYAKNRENILVTGIMGVMPKSADEKLYLSISDLYDRISKSDANVKYLSLGMSEDFETAIRYNSNVVRIGTKIFGQRIYSDDEVKHE